MTTDSSTTTSSGATDGTQGTASTAAAKCGLKPVRFMSGIEIGPSTMTLATALPEIVPKSEDETTATLPGPWNS